MVAARLVWDILVITYNVIYGLTRRHIWQEEPSETDSLLDTVEKKVFSMHSTNPDVFTDPDTILADLFSKVDMQLTGTSEELFNIYRRSGDKQIVKDLFLFFTDISFDEYLQKCIEETASLAVADLKS